VLYQSYSVMSRSNTIGRIMRRSRLMRRLVTRSIRLFRPLSIRTATLTRFERRERPKTRAEP
jgi:hypothetical protein